MVATTTEILENITNDNGVVPSNPKERIAQDAEQFRKLLQELTNRVKEVKEQLEPTLTRATSHDIKISKGISYLSVKHHALLQYITNLAFFLHLKLSGKQVAGHPFVESLVELRTLLEKMKPLEQKLKYQIDKLVRAAAAGVVEETEQEKGGKSGKKRKTLTAGLSDAAVVGALLDVRLADALYSLVCLYNAAADPLAFRPNPANLTNIAAEMVEEKEEGWSIALSVQLIPNEFARLPTHKYFPNLAHSYPPGPVSSGLYRVKKIAPVTYDDTQATSKAAKSASRLAEKAARSRVMRELVTEMDDRPEEVDALGGVNEGMGFGDRADQALKERDQYEEENFVRLMMSKKDKKRLMGTGRMRLEDEFDNLNDFSNLVGIQNVEEQESERLKSVLNRRKQPRRQRDSEDDDDERNVPESVDARAAKRGRSGAERSTNRLFNGLIEDPERAKRGNTKFDKAKQYMKKGKNGKKGRK
ncbi:Sas10/Utp3/C1D family-domain-containing protein [Endogone sp. FLAS-F59071]|nr:Sas10/Utp3/C1D family-domain-containing protein [Endogone sp. FLAS-F59071]|eukprot:RUS17395.1 Sas10/Utp3/C1D family-domain-containing protein [Endogone sp. FLAS-F59071]